MSQFWRPVLVPCIVATLQLGTTACGDLRLLGTADGADGDGVEGDGANADAADVDPSAWLEVVGEAVGETGWGDSTTPWAPPPAAIESGTACGCGGLWSEPGAVFVGLSWGQRAGPPHAMDIQVNRGAGWASFFTTECAALWTDPSMGGDCPRALTGQFAGGLLTWDAPVARIRESAYWLEGVSLSEPFTVRDELAYALSGNETQPVIRYEGGTWGPVSAIFPTAVQLSDLWANETTVAVVGRTGTLRVLNGTEWHQWDTGTLLDLQLVWGFDDGELWVSSGRELWRCRDEACIPMAWPDRSAGDPCGGGGIQRMWGADGVLFFANEHQLVRWDGAAFEVLAYWPGTFVSDPDEDDCRGGGLWIRSMWGNSPTELFLCVDGLGSHLGNCATHHLLRWDGTEFHWF